MKFSLVVSLFTLFVGLSHAFVPRPQTSLRRTLIVKPLEYATRANSTLMEPPVIDIPRVIVQEDACQAVEATATTATIGPRVKPTKPISTTPVFDKLCKTPGVTLNRFMNQVATLNPELENLCRVFEALGTASKAIACVVKRCQLPFSDTLGYQGKVNVQGEDQRILDVITNDILKSHLKLTGCIGVLASEEEEEPIQWTGTRDGLKEQGQTYVAVIDPLDGSANVDVGIPTGTIMGLYKHDPELGTLDNALQAGTSLVAAAYVLYSSSTILALTLGNGVYSFTLDESLGEFVLCKPDLKIPDTDTSSIYSYNQANTDMWDQPMQDCIRKWREGKGRSGKKFSYRYIGSMVGDIHRTLLYGGVFGYPGDSSNPNGKLRLLYECGPMSFIMEQAGGLSTTGTERLLEVRPRNIHQRVPVVMGSKDEVRDVIDAYSAWKTR